jgi:hypothetical protein
MNDETYYPQSPVLLGFALCGISGTIIGAMLVMMFG